MNNNKIHKFNINNMVSSSSTYTLSKNEPLFCIKCGRCFDHCCSSILIDVIHISDIKLVNYLNELKMDDCIISDEEYLIKSIIE